MPVVQSKFRAYLSHSEPITANQLIIEYDNASYQVEKDSYGGYGNNGLIANSGSSGLPFYIRSEENNQTAVYTSSAGQHTIKISEYTSNVETSECFKKAVKSAVGSSVMMLSYRKGEVQGATWQEAHDAIQNGTMIYLEEKGVVYPCTYFDPSEIMFVLVDVRSDTGVTAYSYTWMSNGTVTYEESTYPSQS